MVLIRARMHSWFVSLLQSFEFKVPYFQRWSRFIGVFESLKLVKIFLNFSYQGFIALALFLPQSASSFVLISGPAESKLDASEVSPSINFQVTTEIPSINKKEEFLDGQYADLSDQDFFGTLIQLAMDQWNNVSTSYINLTYSFTDQATLDASDYVHTIAISSVNLVAAASASPRYQDGIIYDCDITLGDRTTSAKAMAYTLMHELGHCLGLGHNHSDRGAVMGYSRTSTELKLGADDILGVTYLYANSQVDTPTQLVSCGSIGSGEDPPWHNVLLILSPLGLFILSRKKNLHNRLD